MFSEKLKEELTLGARQAIRSAGRYLSLDDMLQILGIGNNTFYDVGLSVTQLNSLEGYDQPIWAFAAQVGEALRELFLEVDSEKTFNTCVSPKGYRLRYDYYVAEYRLLVEADGDQHWNTESIWYSDYRKECDTVKDNWAANNGYVLIRIPYTPRAKQIRKAEVARIVVEELGLSAVVLGEKYRELKKKADSIEYREISLPVKFDPTEPHSFRSQKAERGSEVNLAGIPQKEVLCLCGLPYGRHFKHSVITTPRGQPRVIYTATEGPLPEPTKYVCQRRNCGKVFMVTAYRPGTKREKKYCSLSCNSSIGLDKEELEDIAYTYLVEYGQWQTLKQVARATGISKSTYWRYDVDIIRMNQELNYQDPERTYSESINIIRTAIRKAGRRLKGQEMAEALGVSVSMVSKLGLTMAEMNALEGHFGGVGMPNGGARKPKIDMKRLENYQDLAAVQPEITIPSPQQAKIRIKTKEEPPVVPPVVPPTEPPASESS